MMGTKDLGEGLAAIWKLLQDITIGQGIEMVFVLSIKGVWDLCGAGNGERIAMAGLPGYLRRCQRAVSGHSDD